jgi:hypothetical protein
MAADQSLTSPIENTPPAPARPRGLLGALQRLVPRVLTKAERNEQAAAKAEMARLRTLKAELDVEAEHYARLIPEKLEQLNICYRYKKSEKDFGERVKRVQFRRPYVLTEEAIYLEVDMRPGALPRGVGISHLEPDDVLRNLGIVCGHRVSKKWAEGVGFWFIIEREYGVRGIPAHVDYNAMLLSRPASASGLYLPLGIGEGKKAVWKDLGQMPHMLMGGTTGAGKSNALNAMLCTLLRFNSPRKLRLVLVDLKGGIEFAPYLGVPHIWKWKDADGVEHQGVIENRGDVIPMFNRVLAEGERRMVTLRDGRMKHIGKYNTTHPKQPWPHIVVVIDEWADVKLDPKVKGPAEELVINMASRFRAVGIHLILCTQVPTRETVPTRLKTVLPARVALSCPDLAGSMTIIGNGRAVRLEPSGRMVLNWAKLNLPIQGPRITDETVEATVRQAINQKFEEVTLAAHDVTPQEIFEWSINENTGHLDYRGVLQKFAVRGVTEPWARAFCKDAEGELVVVGATTYKVMAGGPGVPRRLLEFEVELDPEAEEPNEPAVVDPAAPLVVAVAPIVPPAQTCAHCGQAVEGTGPCAHCGAPAGSVPPPAPALPVDQRIVAALAEGPLNAGKLYSAVLGNRTVFQGTVALLLAEGVISVEVVNKQGAKLYRLVDPLPVLDPEPTQDPDPAIAEPNQPDTGAEPGPAPAP